METRDVWNSSNAAAYGNYVGSNVTIDSIADHRISLYQFLDTNIERNRGAKTGRLDLGVRDDVVSLVRIFAHRRFHKHEIRHVFLDRFAQFLLDTFASERPTLYTWFFICSCLPNACRNTR